MDRILLKIMMLGDSKVGKTSIITRYVSEEFSHTNMPTISPTFYEKDEDVAHYKIRLQIWDTSGQEKFSSISQMFYREAHACVLVFSSESEESLNRLEYWESQFLKVVRQDENLAVPIIILCNKSDKKMNKNLKKKLESDQKIEFYDVSASKGTGIHKVFSIISERALQYKMDFDKKNKPPEKPNLEINLKNKDSRQCCLII
jgi:Ras-related protein Rab-7A